MTTTQPTPPDCEHAYEEVLVPFIPRWGWMGYDYRCSRCDALREDSFSRIATSSWVAANG